MAYVRQVEHEAATGPLKKVFDAAAAREGKLANIVQLMGLDARVAASSMRFYASIMKTPNALSASRREMLATVVSVANGCHY